MEYMKILILGIGQSLRGDDGAGLVAVRSWQAQYPLTASHTQISCELSELPGLGLLDLLAGAKYALLVDAVHTQSEPGTLHILSESDLAAFGPGFGSVHGWGVAETLALGRQLGQTLPERVDLLGIQVGRLNMGTVLSDPVQASISQAAEKIEQWIQKIFCP